MLNSQHSHYKTDTMFHFLFFAYRVVFLVIYDAAYLGHRVGRLYKPVREFIFHLSQFRDCRLIE